MGRRPVIAAVTSASGIHCSRAEDKPGAQVNTKERALVAATGDVLTGGAVSDLLLGVFCMPFTLVGQVLRNFVFGGAMCKLIPYFQGNVSNKLIFKEMLVNEHVRLFSRTVHFVWWDKSDAMILFHRITLQPRRGTILLRSEAFETSSPSKDKLTRLLRESIRHLRVQPPRDQFLPRAAPLIYSHAEAEEGKTVEEEMEEEDAEERETEEGEAEDDKVYVGWRKRSGKKESRRKEMRRKSGRWQGGEKGKAWRAEKGYAKEWEAKERWRRKGTGGWEVENGRWRKGVRKKETGGRDGGGRGPVKIEHGGRLHRERGGEGREARRMLRRKGKWWVGIWRVRNRRMGKRRMGSGVVEKGLVTAEGDVKEKVREERMVRVGKSGWVGSG
ncbi:Neuropeptide SIFamide receptor [Gryllus bimaculatus]|nr:Neuropeptide SIFamide receptor [Gryllus bimaculatus]